MVRTRLSVVLIGLAVLIATAGCIGFLTGDEALEVEASPTTVDDATLEESGYELARNETIERTMEVSVADQTRQANVTSEIREYNRSVSIAGAEGRDVARFSAFSAPSISLAGRTVNPVGDWSEDRLVSEAVGSTGAIDDVEFQDNRTARALGEDRTISRYSAVIETDGVETNATIHLATIGHEGDFVVAVAVHPEDLDERDRVDAMFRGLEHASEPE